MTDLVNTMGTRQSSVEANMGQARRWASVALSGLVAASLCLAAPGPAMAASAGTEVLDWNVSGSVEAGGIYSFGERSSSKFDQYRDMDNGFVGGLSLQGEKKDSPYFFDLRVKNPARDDQAYGGALGRYGLFRLDLLWDRTPHVLSNSAQTIFQESGSDFTLPPTLRTTITTPITVSPIPNAANCGAGTIVSWNCPNPLQTSTPIPSGGPQFNFIRGTINGLLRPLDLAFNTDVGSAGLKLTPSEDLRFDLEYSNLRREGYRPLGTVIGGPGGSPTELAIPIDNMTQEVKFGAEFARADYALQFNYSGSIFRNEFDGYTWDNPLQVTDQATSPSSSSRGQISAAPNNLAHTFSLTGTAALPLRTRISGTFAYSMQRQDETFLPNTPITAAGITRTNADDAGNTSPDAKVNLVLGNIVLNSRPINNVTVTARYRYFEYQNDTPLHVFSFSVPTGQGAGSLESTSNLRFTKQNAGLDLGWRPIQQVALKAGYEYEHWNRGDFDDTSFSTAENIAKASMDVTPVDWFLGRVTYRYGDRNLKNYPADPTFPASVPQFFKFNYADKRSNRVDLLLQFSLWDTLTPSLTFGYANDDYNNSRYGLTSDINYSAGGSLSWSPLSWLQFSADYTYELHDYKQANASGAAINDWESKGKDEFHTVSLNAVVNLIPKKLDLTVGYGVTFGYTTIRTANTGAGYTPPPITATSTSTTQAFDWDKIQNVLQTFRVMGRYRLTEKLQLRGGFAYERYNEKDFARDPMQPFMGDFERVTPTSPFPVTAGIQSVYLGATVPNYEAYILSAFVRYEF